MLWILFIIESTCSQLEPILNKKIRIRSIPYTNLVITEKLSDFSDQVFYFSDVNYLTSDFNDIALIEKDKGKYKIKIGNFYICRSKNWSCGTTSDKNICLDKNNDEMNCEQCKEKAIEQCEENITLWKINRVSLGFIILLDGKCLTLGHRVKLETCSESKEQLFGFEDYEFISCLLKLSTNKKPENYKELLDQKKLEKIIEDIKDPAVKKIILDKKNKNKDFDEFIKKEMPSLAKKPKMKSLWRSLWKGSFKRPFFNWKMRKLKSFCTKWW